MSTIAAANSQRSNGLQTIFGLMLVAKTSNDQVIQTLNHAGVSVSSSTIWRVVKEHAKTAEAETKMSRGEMWAYDNVNVLKRVRQVRKEKHAEMFNWTSRAAFPLKRPEGAEPLSCLPQGSRKNLSSKDILPGVEDVRGLKGRLMAAVKAFFLKKFVNPGSTPVGPARRWVPKTKFRPLALLNQDESTTSGNIEILRTFAREAAMNPDNCWDQLVTGDQATCKNIRGARRLLQDDFNAKEKLTWAKENPGDFHFLWEVAKCILLAHWSKSEDVGTIGFLRDLVDRRTIDKKGSNFNALDDFLHHVYEALMTAAMMTHLKLESASQQYQGEDTADDIALSFMQTFVYKPKHQRKSDDELLHLTTSMLYHLLLYMDLRQAIRYENGPVIVSHWRFWLPTFLGTGRSQYSTEAANFIANLSADWSEEVAVLATNNRTVNTHGREGHGKPVDMAVEHQNKIFKDVVRGSGGHLTYEHARVVSLAIPLFDAARRFCSRVFNTRQTVGHTTPSAEKDIRVMTEALVRGSVFIVTPGRRLVETFVDPVTKGMRRITEDRWLDNFLKKGNGQEPQVQSNPEANPDDSREGGADTTSDDENREDGLEDNGSDREDEADTDMLMDE